MRTSLTLIATLSIISASCSPADEKVTPSKALTQSTATPESLTAHTNELREDVIRVTDTVTVAVGFGLANAILVEGETCNFVVDTTESREIATRILKKFTEISDAPIDALIYTHNHADHVFGAEIFDGGRGIDIYAHEKTAAEVDKAINIIRPILSTRSARMFGTYLTADDNAFINAGLGPGLGVTGPNGGSIGYLPPTQTFSDTLETELCGRRVVLRHAPGETDDQLYVWLPDEKVLMPGDNIYKAFPNLYTIRGTSYRDVTGWATALDEMRKMGAEHLVPSHTRPISGAEKIAETLMTYADGIRFVHDQTIRYMNKGFTPDALVESVILPPHLKDHPFLQEHYGTVRWSVRSIYEGYLGWFNGDGAFLNPAKSVTRAETLSALAKTETTLTEAAEKALTDGRHALAAELATYAIKADDDARRARTIKADALEAMGRVSVSPNGRNYLLTQAGELRGDITLTEGGIDERSISFVRRAPIANFMLSLPVNLNAHAARDIQRIAAFHFTDTQETFTVEVRRGVAIVTPEAASAHSATPDIEIETTTAAWIDLLTGQRGATAAIASGDIKITGGPGQALAFANFMKLFRD